MEPHSKNEYAVRYFKDGREVRLIAIERTRLYLRDPVTRRKWWQAAPLGVTWEVCPEDPACRGYSKEMALEIARNLSGLEQTR